MDNNPEDLHLGLTARLVRRFIESKLPTLIIIISLLAGAAALLLTPREEDPQITVPMVDILIRFPGAAPAVPSRPPRGKEGRLLDARNGAPNRSGADVSQPRRPPRHIGKGGSRCSSG